MQTQLIKKKNITPENSESKLLRWSRRCLWFIRVTRHPLLCTGRPSVALSTTTPLTPLRPDWDLWAYITSKNCPAATSSFSVDIERDRARSNERGQERLVAWQLCLCTLCYCARKEVYGWQHGERRGEGMWEGQQWFGTDRGEEEHHTKYTDRFYRVILHRESESEWLLWLLE